MTEMERQVIASVTERYGSILNLETEPGVILEILKRYKNDLDRTDALPEEYVQVETGAVGGVGHAGRTIRSSAEAHHSDELSTVAGEITNSELMRELLKLRKQLSDFTHKP